MFGERVDNSGVLRTFSGVLRTLVRTSENFLGGSENFGLGFSELWPAHPRPFKNWPWPWYLAQLSSKFIHERSTNRKQFCEGRPHARK